MRLFAAARDRELRAHGVRPGCTDRPRLDALGRVQYSGRRNGLARECGAEGNTNGIALGYTDFGTSAYGGAAPPPGDPPHRYVFTLYALDLPKLDLDSKTTIALLGFVIRDNILGRATLTGRYGRYGARGAQRPADSGPDRARLHRRGVRLEYTTLAWNVAGAAFVFWAAFLRRTEGA